MRASVIELSRASINDYIQYHLWAVISDPCHNYPFLALKSPYMVL